MDATKRKTLIEWVNSLAVAESIESLRQLQDGRHLLALTNLVEGIPQQSDIESNERRWELILNFLEGLYQCSMTGKIDRKAVLYNCHEFEIAKVCLLVISAAMLCERNTVFVERAMQMEVELQHEIRDMVEWVIQPNQNLADLDPSFHHVLAKKLDLCAYEMKDLNPQASSTPQSCNQRSRTAQSSTTPTMNRVQQAGIGTTPVFSTSILGRFTSPGPNQTMSPMSPVQQMVQSPNMANKIRLQQKEQRIKLLERELNAKKHLVAEYEAEIEEKRKDVDLKEKSVLESREKLQQALRRISQLQANVEDLQSQDVSMQQGADYERMHLIKNENAELTQRNKQLEEENGSLYNQLHSTQGQLDQLESIRQKMSDYHSRLHESDRDLCTLRVTLEEKNQLITQLSEATERAHSELAALRDTHRHELLDMHSQLERAAGAMMGAGESLGGVMEIKYTEELEALKSEMNEYEQKLQEKAGHVLELLTRNEELSNEKSELSSCKVQLLGQVEQLSNSLKITQQNLSQSMETSAMWEQKTHALEITLEDVQNTSAARIADLESQISESQQEIASHLKQLAASHEAVNNLQNAMQSAHESFAQQKKSLSAQIQNSEMEMAKLEEALKSTEGSLRCKEEEVNGLKGELQNTQETFMKELQSKEATNTSLQEQLQSLEDGLRATHRDLSQQLEHKDALLRDLTSEFESKKVEFASMYEQMEHQLMEQKSANDNLDAELSMKKQEVENMKLKSQEDHQCYQSQKSELEEQLKSKSEELTQVIGFRAQDMEEHQVQRITLEQNLNSVQEALHMKETALEDIKTALDEAESRVLKLEEDVKENARVSENEKQELLQQLKMAENTWELTRAELEGSLRNKTDVLSQVKLTMAQQNEEHQTQIDTLSKDLSSAQCTLESKDNALVELGNKLSVAESKIGKLEDEVKQHERTSADQKQELSRQLEMATMSGDEQRETVQRLSLQLQEASLKVEETENTLQALRSEGEAKEQQWNAKVDEFEKTVEIISELRQQLQESEVELRQMGGQLDEVSERLRDTEKTRDAFMTRVQEQDLVISNLNSQLLESETQSEEEKSKTGRLTEQLRAMEEEKSQMRQELDGECERVEAMEMELMELQQVSEMKEQELQIKLEDTCLANESLQSEVVNMRARTQAMEEQFEVQNQKMTKLCDSLKQLSAVDQHRQKELASALEIRQQVMEDLDEAQFRITTLQEELEESKERNASLELSIQQQKENAEAIEARLKEFMDDKEGEMSTLEVELTDYDEKLKESKAQVTEYKVHCENAQTLILSLQMELEDNTKKVAALEESLKVAQEALFDTEKEKEQAEQHLMQSRTSLCGKEDHLSAMQEKVAKLKEELEASNERVTQLQDTLTIFEQKAADWERKHHDAETEAERKEMKLESDLERAEEEIEELNNKIALLEKNHSDAMGRLNQEELALKEARLNESTLRQELQATRMELSTKHETLHTMEVQQAGQIEQVVTEGNVVLRSYEQKISDVQEQAKAACQQYEAQIQELHSVLRQTQAVAEEKVNSHIHEMTKLKQDQKEEVKVLGRQIESLSSELQSLKCWEMSERTSIKELEAKCEDMEQQVAKSHKENVVLSLKLQSTEKELSDLKGDQLGEKTILAEQIESIKQLETELEGVKTELMNAEVQYTEELKKLGSEWKEKLTALEDQKQQALEQYQQIAHDLQETDNELEKVKRDHAEELSDIEVRCDQMQEIMENQVQRLSESVSDKEKLEKKHEQEVAQLKEEHFQHQAEMELNYQLEVEQLEAELLKVKSEVEHKQGLLIAVEDKAASAQNDAHSELIGLEKDKLDLESKLESRDRQLKAAKDDLVRAMRVQEVKAMEVVEHQKKVRQLEREIHKMMEREKRHLEAHRRETSLGADMNAKLQQQVADLNAEIAAKEQAYQGQMEEMMRQVSDMQDKYKEELEHLEEKNYEALSQETAKWCSKFDKLEDRHAKSEAARQRQIELVQDAQGERDTMKDQVTLLEKQLSTVCAERDRCEEQLQEASNLKNQLREEEMLNKRQANQVRSLEAQLDHATRQLKADGRERSLVPPPQPPPFPETPANLRRSTRIASVNSQASPKSDDEFTKPYDLRSNKSSEGALSLKDIMTTPGPEGRYLSRLSFAGSMGPTPRKSPSALSTRSSVSQHPESASTERSRSMRLSISSNSSHESMQSNNPPFVSGALFSMEDEPTEFEWDRLSELQRRNTLCLPHLKSSYPTEVQTVKPKKMSELTLQKGEPLMTPMMEGKETRSKSRKRTSTEMSDDNHLNSRRKTFAGPMLAKSSTSTLNGSSGVTLKVYPHYSPHLGNTPKHKLARSSPRGTTPSKKLLTPTGTTLKGPTPKGITPRRGKKKGSTPKPATPKTQSKKSENASPKPKKAPTAFNIGFTPKKSGRLTQLLRRKKTGDGTPKVKQQLTTKKPTLTKPLGDHNRR